MSYSNKSNLILRRKLVNCLSRYACESIMKELSLTLKKPWLSNVDQLRILILDKWSSDWPHDDSVKKVVLRYLEKEVY